MKSPRVAARELPRAGDNTGSTVHTVSLSVPAPGGSPMALTAQQIAEQKKQVEELIAGSDVGFAKALFYGRFKGELLFPYPTLPPEEQAKADEMAAKGRDYANRSIDHMQIDRDARIPDSVIKGLADLGVYRLTIPT